MLLARQQTLRLQNSGDKSSIYPATLPPRQREQADLIHAQKRVRIFASAESEVQAGEDVQSSDQKQAKLEPTKRLFLRFSTANLPHPDKSDYGGEDAFFISPVGGGAFGIADGVGGWQDSGINPAEYSRTFMRLACAYMEGKSVDTVNAKELNTASSDMGSRSGLLTPADASLTDSPPSESAGRASSMKTLTPQGALTAAHTGTRLPGSTTACVLRLDRTTNKLSAANLGDSGFLLIRDGRATFRSPALQHFFDCPLQFAAYPDYTNATDTSDDAGLYELPIQPGDLIVAGTDGLWDNVQQDEIVELMCRNNGSTFQAAPELAALASRHAHDKKYASPYSQEAVKQGIDLPWFLRIANSSFSEGKFRLGHMKGGKVDDITIVVAYVDEESHTPEQAMSASAGGPV